MGSSINQQPQFLLWDVSHQQADQGAKSAFKGKIQNNFQLDLLILS